MSKQMPHNDKATKQPEQSQPQSSSSSPSGVCSQELAALQQQRDQIERSDLVASTDTEKSASGYVFHRTREQPTPDFNEPAIKQIKFYLDRYKIKEALQIFFHESTLNLLRDEPDFLWEIIPLICKRLRGLCQYRFRVFEGCERMLCRIAVDENCNPKEVLISLLAEISQHDQAEDDNVFRAMIRPLEGTLLRMSYPTPRDENFRWVLSVLIRHINDIELPREYNLEGKKRLALPNDPSVKRFLEVLPLTLNFIQEFNERPIDYDKSPMPILTESQIDEVLNGELVDDDLINDPVQIRSDNADACMTALLGLMRRPLTYLDLTHYCPELRTHANKCLNTLLKLMPNLFSPIYKRICVKSYNSEELHRHYQAASIVGGSQSNSGAMFDNDPLISLANSCYIYRCERSIATPYEIVHFFPQIMTHESILMCHVPYIVALLRRTEIIAHEKGLSLLESVLRDIERDSLKQKFLDLLETSTMNEQLFQIMVYSPLCTNRRRAFDTFTNICDLLTYDCKVKLFTRVLTQTDLRPCVRAACIDQYRKHLTIINKELMNLDQQLSIVTASSSLASSDQSWTRSDAGTANKSFEEETNPTDVDSNQPLDEATISSRRGAEKVLAVGEALKRQFNDWQSKYKFVGGQALVDFLNLCISACLPESQHTDIIENYELLLATLTIFRFLRLRKTLTENEIEKKYLNGKKLKKSLFDPIRNAVALIMTELKLHHNEIVEGHRAKNVNSKSKKHLSSHAANITQPRSEYDMVAKLIGPKMDDKDELTKDDPEFSERDEAECLNWVLCRLDLVESVLVRTCDLYNC